VIDIIVMSLFTFALGFALGRSENKPKPTEEPKDFAYYKNLSESLLSDVRRLREDLRKANER
jgi:hypothetical protein